MISIVNTECHVPKTFSDLAKIAAWGRLGLIAAISYWNTVYLDRAAQHLNAVGTTFDAALLAHLSPMGWAHISLTGDYLWEQARRLPAGEFHPLNEPMARLKRVA